MPVEGAHAGPASPAASCCACRRSTINDRLSRLSRGGRSEAPGMSHMHDVYSAPIWRAPASVLASTYYSDHSIHKDHLEFAVL
jgi:hypothetical protein